MLGKIFKTIVDVAALPIDAASDVFTLGSSLTDNRGSYIIRKLNKIEEDLDDIL